MNPGAGKKVLYENHGSDDAHTTDAFLEALVVNATVARRSYRTVVWDSLPVNQQLSTVTLVATMSYLLTQGRLTPAQLICIQLLLTLVGALLFSLCAPTAKAPLQRPQLLGASPKHNCSGATSNTDCAESAHAAKQPRGSGARRALLLHSGGSMRSGPTWSRVQSLLRSSTQGLQQLLRPLCTAATFVGATLVLSPVYATLAQSISTDSAVFISVVLLFAHLFLWDYRFKGQVTSRSTALSLGCAILSSILGASRAHTSAAAFAQITLALGAYVLFPQLRAAVLAASPTAHVCLTLALAAAAVRILLPLSVLLTTSFVCACGFVSLICPMWLVRVGKFKAQINGPWDEAVPKLSRDVSLRVASPRKVTL